ncbi:MAG: phosphatase PAP2 family protein [Clostridia bacterium]|nr:phosphatase PAP2 family protein [Clostridia bacterium]
MKEAIVKNKKWILLVISVVLLSWVIGYVFMAQKTYFDEVVYSKIISIKAQPTTIVMKLFTVLGSGITLISIIFTSFCTGYKKYAKYMTINLMMITILNQILKIVFNRPRPEEFRLITESGYSFPSGHSMISMAFYGLIVYWMIKRVKKPIIKWSLVTIFMLLIIGIGISRIYLGVHYASDVIGGFCFSIAYLLCFLHLIERRKEGEPN